MTTSRPRTFRPNSEPVLRAPDGADTFTHQRSLRSKIVLALAAVFLIFLVVDQIVLHQLIEPEFASLERIGATRDANRVLAAISAEVGHVSDLAEHWASQIRETDIDSDFRRSGWGTQTLTWAAFADRRGNLNWLVRGTSVPAALIPDNVDQQVRSLIDGCRDSPGRESSGMTRIGNSSLVLYAAVAIDPRAESRSDGASQQRFLVVGREMDGAMVQRLRRQTQVEFFLQSPRTSNPDQRAVIWEEGPSTLAVEIQLIGTSGENLANVHIRIARDITARSNRITALARDSFVFGAVAALLILMLLLQRIVIGPLTAIREHSNRVAEEGLNTRPLVLSGNDEISQLADTFDKMVSRLSDAQSQLTKASQAEGRSQVASTVIHNVGNVLTNVNSLLDAASDRVSGLRIGSLDMLANRLKDGDSNDGLLAATPDYLAGLAGSLKSDQESIGEMLSTLHDNVRHIHDVIRDQQRHTKREIKSSAIQLEELIEEAIACSRARLEQDSVTVNVSGDLSATIVSDRSLLLQVMINVIGNARNAMRDNDSQSRELRIEVMSLGTSVRVRLNDNGCGMTEETMRKAFDAHYTTRESGSGLGLHFCSITLKRLGGTIRLSSDGPGCGSTIEIELPASQQINLSANSAYNPSTTAVGAEG